MGMRQGESTAEYSARMTAEATAAFYKANPDLLRTLRNPEMPLASQMLYSKYISKADVPSPIALTIRGVTLDGGGRNGEDPRWLMYFHELRKALRLNNTTIRQLESTFGPNSDVWIGKKVRLYVDPNVTMAGQVVGGVRMQMPRSAGAPAGWPQPADAGPAGPRFDPMTGQPINQKPPAGARFDAMTGLPLQPAQGSAPPESSVPFDSATGETSAPSHAVDPEFDDDIPF